MEEAVLRSEPRVDGIWRVLWRDLPLVNLAICTLAAGYLVAVSLASPWPWVLLMAGLGTWAPVVLYARLWPQGSQAERALGLLVVPGTLVLLALLSMFVKPRPVDPDLLRGAFEVLALVNVALLGVHAWRQERAPFALFFGPVAVYGALLENGGIALGYFSEERFTFYLPFLPAPLVTMASWITILYLSIWVTWRLRARIPSLGRSPLRSALVATAVGLTLDLQVEPLARILGFWTWNPELDAGACGAPLLNYVAWVSALLPFAFVLFHLQDRRGLEAAALGRPPHLGWLWARVPLVVGAATLLFFTTMAILEGGLHGPTFLILRRTLEDWGLGSAGVVLPG